MNEISVDDVLQFWFEDIEHSRWFKKDPDFDRELERRFGALLTLAKRPIATSETIVVVTLLIFIVLSLLLS